MKKKIGIITFHNSYNCGSMLETYAIQEAVREECDNVEIINYSSDGQKDLYSVFYSKLSLKNIIRNLIILFWSHKILRNNRKYIEFQKRHFCLSDEICDKDKIEKSKYSIVVAGSDQIWNTTIKDASDHYFVDWTDSCRKVAYAPSFGAKDIQKYSNNPKKYRNLICSFDALSIREKNGQKWLKELTGRDAELLIDPTLLFGADKYEKLLDDTCTPKYKYIFFYCPRFNNKICKLVKNISKEYKMPVVCWSTKSYAIKQIWHFGFKLPKYESPAVYLSLIKNAELIITTSFHGTIFSTIFRKKFFIVKNGDMFGDDDRVKTLVEQLGIDERLIQMDFDSDYDYLKPVDYSKYEKNLPALQKKAKKYIKREVVEPYEEPK